MMTTPMSEILQPYTDNDDNSNKRNIAALKLTMMTTRMSEIFSNRTQDNKIIEKRSNVTCTIVFPSKKPKSKL